jgi:hypothetical protein
MAISTNSAKSAHSTKGRPVAKAARVAEKHLTKAKPVAAKPKPAKKAVKAKAESTVPTVPVPKKKRVAAPTKPKPPKKWASSGPHS